MKTMTIIMLLPLVAAGVCLAGAAAPSFQADTFKTDGGDLTITFIGHGTLMLTYNDKVIHVDPWSRLADYEKLPRADLILITHHHQDHLDTKAIETLRKPETALAFPEACKAQLGPGLVMKNGDTANLIGLKILATPAYNIVHKRENGAPFHPEGEGNGYVIQFGDKKAYVAGDTEVIPEMKTLTDIAIAFLPMNLPYTMTPEMTAEAARIIRPDILYPYHYGETDPGRLKELLADAPEIDVRIRDMK